MKDVDRLSRLEIFAFSGFKLQCLSKRLVVRIAEVGEVGILNEAYVLRM